MYLQSSMQKIVGVYHHITWDLSEYRDYSKVREKYKDAKLLALTVL